jgi:hypothetical protein
MLQFLVSIFFLCGVGEGVSEGGFCYGSMAQPSMLQAACPDPQHQQQKQQQLQQ